eukprot:gene1994-2482_t
MGVHLYAVRWREDAGQSRLFVAGEQGLLARSDDAGQHFTALPSPYKGSFFGLASTPSALLVHGLRDYGPVDMAGVIANRVASPGHAAMVAASLRDIPLFATLPKQARSLPERHLGLVLPSEVDGIDDILDQLADQLNFDEAAWSNLRGTRLEL